MAAAGTVRPRIGADRFRALTERLKNPSAPVPHIAVAPAVVLPITVPPIEVQPVPPPDEHAEPSVTVAPPPELASAPDVSQDVYDVTATASFAPEPEILPQDNPEVPQHAPPAQDVGTPDQDAAGTEEVMTVEAEAEPAVAPELVLEVAPEFPPEAMPDIPPEPVAVPAIEPVFEPAPAQPAAAAPQAHLSPLDRILSAEHKVAAPVALPEILPPPPPPPPPLVIEENGEKITVAPPSMDAVQERLREDASNRLQQLDIENIWRQVLATPTLEERAEFLREAAEIMAEEQGVDVAAMLAPEHDLSRIEVSAEPVVEEPAAALVADYSEDEQVETAELARSLLDMMASGSSSGLPHERALAADTLLRLLPKLAVKPLAMLSQRLAIMDNPPQLLVAKLIRDDRVEVSGPLLEDCMHITDQDLAMVVAEENPGKRRMVARRRRLSRAISDKLIATADASVLLTLVRNANAEISHDGFNALIEAAAKHDELMAPLSTRGDLGAPHAFELFWPAPPQLRRYLLHRFLTDSETLTKILKITLSAQAGDEGKDDVNLPSAGDVMEYLEVACRGRTETAAAKLGEALNVDAAAIHRILMDREGEALVVMLKAAGFPRSSVGDLLPALKRGEIALLAPERDTTELQTMFDTLSLNKARILLTYWNWAVRKAGPYAPVH
jgi:uncharacterized protein (DUF2336 family)